MKDGKLSFTMDDRKRRKINIAELDGLYEKRAGGNDNASDNNVKNSSKNTELNVKKSDYNISRLEAEVEFLKHELQNRQQETERWQEAFDKAQSTADKITALLEDRSHPSKQEEKRDEWKDSIQALENRIANQESKTQEEQERAQKILRQNQTLKKALEEEKNKSIWKKLFG